MASNTPKKNEEYVSPLVKELNKQTQLIGEGVRMYHDRKNNHILLDIDVTKKIGWSSSFTTMALAKGTYKINDKSTLSVNAYTKDFTQEDLDEKEKGLELKIREAQLKKQENELKALNKK